MKINKLTLLQKPYNKGFIWLDRYSNDESTDDIGRWAMIGYYNGFMICWITGFVTMDGVINDSKNIGICNKFIVNLRFPTSSNESCGVEILDSIEDAKKYAESMFNNFKKLINK